MPGKPSRGGAPHEIVRFGPPRRVAALEILVVTPAISNLIREATTFQIPGMLQVGKKYGMQTLDDAIMDMLNKKMISPEDAYDKAKDKNKFKPLLKTPPNDWA